ncbi:MAG: preprotein translocase subunit YajC [Clostridiales bacterium]|nr:preprotein translocase subunit YajC [Clostridiales bacterium]MDY4895348.1 preprotein translocase subunit YajC [Christensenellaceae bacterium]
MLQNLMANSNIGSIVFIVLIVAAFVAMMIFNSRSTKKRQQESQKMLDAIKPGNKVKTIGGICGVVVEVNAEENTFVLETGTEASGKSYIKFDKQAVYQTDAVAEDAKKAKEAKKEEKSDEPAETKEDAKSEEPASSEEKKDEE